MNFFKPAKTINFIAFLDGEGTITTEKLDSKTENLIFR
jgi:hypothetical protein